MRVRSLIVVHTGKEEVIQFCENSILRFISHGFLQHEVHIFSKLSKASRGHGNASIPEGPGKPGRPRKPRRPSRPSSP
jgi:hypothetical protein